MLTSDIADDAIFGTRDGKRLARTLRRGSPHKEDIEAVATSLFLNSLSL